MPRGQLFMRATPCLLLVILGGGLLSNVSAEPDEIMENSILQKRAPLAELEDAENSPFQELSRRASTVILNGRKYVEVHKGRIRKKAHHGGGHRKKPHHHPPHNPSPHPHKPPSPKPPSPPPPHP